MSAKNWLKSFFLFGISIVSLFEINYQLSPGNRHEVDYLVKEFLPALKDKSYEVVILGDSLAHNAFSELKLKENILDLSSNKAISLAGNYYILKRYLQNNHAPKKVYLFAIPSFLHYDLNDNLTYSYFETVFTKKDEISEMKRYKPTLYGDVFNLDKYFERRKNALNLGGYKPKNRRVHVDVNESELEKKTAFINKPIQANIDEAKAFRERLERMPKAYFDKIVQLCHDKGVELTVVIEPIFEAYQPIFNGSKWDNYLKNRAKKGDFIYKNINNYYSFNAYFFKRDGRHITGKVNSYYQSLIDRYILDIY